MSSLTKSVLLVVLAVTSTTAAQGLNLFCVDKSYRTSPLLWTLENFQYSSRVKIGSFRLTNKQSDFSTLIYCDTGLCRPAPDDDSNPAGDGQGYLGSNITGTVNLTGGMANVAFYQTWTCDNHDLSIVFPFKFGIAQTTLARASTDHDADWTVPDQNSPAQQQPGSQSNANPPPDDVLPSNRPTPSPALSSPPTPQAHTHTHRLQNLAQSNPPHPASLPFPPQSQAIKSGQSPLRVTQTWKSHAPPEWKSSLPRRTAKSTV
ncbi:hypothetical protein V8F33_009874 [Rhypophila sp. PSN 637]